MPVRDPVVELHDTRLYKRLSELSRDYAQRITVFLSEIAPLLDTTARHFPYYTRHDANHGYHLRNRRGWISHYMSRRSFYFCVQSRRQPHADPNPQDSKCAHPATLPERGSRGRTLPFSVVVEFERSGTTGKGIEISRTCSPAALLIRALADTEDLTKPSRTFVSIRAHQFAITRSNDLM